MIKDLADSKRLNLAIKREAPHNAQLACLDATLVSYLFWPELSELDLRLPAGVQVSSSSALIFEGGCLCLCACTVLVHQPLQMTVLSFFWLVSGGVSCYYDAVLLY